jgi:hypothetical protein
MRKHRGAVLIVVLGVLAILALLATTFASLQATERHISRNYLDTVRAKLLAMSGVQDAVQRLTHVVETSDPRGPNAFMENRVWKFWGDDVNETGTDEALLRVPLERAKNPSFALENDPNPMDPANPQPRPVLVRGPLGIRPVGISGVMQSGTYAVNGDVYSLRVTDLQGLIHVNDGLEHGRDGSVSQNLRRILNNLGAQSAINVPGLGDKILERRPAAGYRSKQEILAAVGYDETVFRRFKEFITVWAWQDEKVANPVPLSDTMVAQGEYKVRFPRGTPAVYRYGRGKDARGNPLAMPLVYAPEVSSPNNENAIYGFDELNPQWIEIVKRAPINVNAAPREVLIAVLDGLKGFFPVERRRNEPPAYQTVYNWLPRAYDYRPSSPAHLGGELAYLYSTIPIQGPGTAGGTGALNSWATWIADEILACRERRRSPHVGGLDYGNVPWGGPFLSWRQWNLFCDRLADGLAGGFLRDDRGIYFDYHPISGGRIDSEIQRRYASRAIGDVLKANFNPNLHLNEMNPDEPLWTRVDKTDLIVHSTEFCFTPMGYYEIESLGRVLRPVGGPDALTAPENEVVAERKVVASVKLFDVFRETNQMEFYQGTLSPRYGAPNTNNNLSLEIGPEPDNGLGPAENEWSGYLALPTIGGDRQGPDWRKEPRTLEQTPQGASEWGSQMHAHYALDTRLHHHVSGKCNELATFVEPNEYLVNAADPTEAEPGPYTPLSGGGNRHRMARSFRMPPLGSGSSAPTLIPAAPLDLRIDGVYLERHCGLGYWLDAATMGDSIERCQGAFGFWVKPGFLPEMTGKTRQFLSADRFHGGNTRYVQPSPFCLWYLASHDSPSMAAAPSESATPIYNLGNPFGVIPMRTSSFTFGYGYSAYAGYAPSGGARGCLSEGGCVTPTLNHLSHPDASFRPSYVRGHRWTHVAAVWNMLDEKACKVYVNGKFLMGTSTAFYPSSQPRSQVKWWLHQNGNQNCLRLGATSGFTAEGVARYARNWPADATLDEFYWWTQVGQLESALTLARLGRYYKPINDASEEGTFTSREFTIGVGSRTPPSPSSIAPPGGGPGSTSTGTSSTGLPEVRLLAAQWTFYGEFCDADKAGFPEMMVDYHLNEEGVPLPAESELYIVPQGGTTYGPFQDARLSRLVEPSGRPIVLKGPFAYKMKLRVRDLELDSELRATPIVDDVTILYQTGQDVFVSYWIE